MQQRAPGSSMKAPEDNHIIDIAAVSVMKHLSARKRTESSSNLDLDLPLYDPHHAPSKKEDASWLRFKEKSIHAVPVILFLCIFILWQFSYPVNLVKKDGKIVKAERIKISGTPNTAAQRKPFDVATLALAKPPTLNNSKNSSRKNETEATASPPLHKALNSGADRYNDQETRQKPTNRSIYFT